LLRSKKGGDTCDGGWGIGGVDDGWMAGWRWEEEKRAVFPSLEERLALAESL
jgi:hypothetical protein